MLQEICARIGCMYRLYVWSLTDFICNRAVEYLEYRTPNATSFEGLCPLQFVDLPSPQLIEGRNLCLFQRHCRVVRACVGQQHSYVVGYIAGN